MAPSEVWPTFRFKNRGFPFEADSLVKIGKTLDDPDTSVPLPPEKRQWKNGEKRRYKINGLSQKIELDFENIRFGNNVKTLLNSL
jgi:hypothetical protein